MKAPGQVQCKCVDYCPPPLPEQGAGGLTGVRQPRFPGLIGRTAFHHRSAVSGIHHTVAPRPLPRRTWEPSADTERLSSPLHQPLASLCTNTSGLCASPTSLCISPALSISPGLYTTIPQPRAPAPVPDPAPAQDRLSASTPTLSLCALKHNLCKRTVADKDSLPLFSKGFLKVLSLNKWSSTSA